MADTDPKPFWLDLTENIMTILFALDYCLRFYCAKKKVPGGCHPCSLPPISPIHCRQLEFFFSFFALIDFLSIVPVWAEANPP